VITLFTAQVLFRMPVYMKMGNLGSSIYNQLIYLHKAHRLVHCGGLTLTPSFCRTPLTILCAGTLRVNLKYVRSLHLHAYVTNSNATEICIRYGFIINSRVVQEIDKELRTNPGYLALCLPSNYTITPSETAISKCYIILRKEKQCLGPRFYLPARHC
jgi:hypothetical protein